MSEKYKKTEKLYEIKEKYGVADDDIVFAMLEANDAFLNNLNQAYKLSENHNEVIKTINKNLKIINARKTKTNILLAILVFIFSFLGGVFFSISPIVNDMLISYQIQMHNESTKFEKKYNSQLLLIQQEYERKKEAVIEDFEIQKIQLEAEKNEAVSQRQNIRANNDVARELQKAGVALNLHKEDGFYTLYMDGASISGNEKIIFKPNIYK